MGIVELIFPKMCVGCRQEGEYICKKCQKKLIKPEGMCPMCCRPSIDGWTHPRCKSRSGMERLIVGLPYKGIVQDCLKKVKYKSSWDIIQFLCGLCNFEEVNSGIVSSVPMWVEKERIRGFNQAELVARCIAGKTGVPSVPTLQRTRNTKPMFGLKKEERRENIEGAFRVMHKCTYTEMHESIVILVDDVWTTGATMRECARVLKKAGANEIWGITLAR